MRIYYILYLYMLCGVQRENPLMATFLTVFSLYFVKQKKNKKRFLNFSINCATISSIICHYHLDCVRLCITLWIEIEKIVFVKVRNIVLCATRTGKKNNFSSSFFFPIRGHNISRFAFIWCAFLCVANIASFSRIGNKELK